MFLFFLSYSPCLLVAYFPTDFIRGSSALPASPAVDEPEGVLVVTSFSALRLSNAFIILFDVRLVIRLLEPDTNPIVNALRKALSSLFSLSTFLAAAICTIHVRAVGLVTSILPCAFLL